MRIIIFSGTSDGRILSGELVKMGFDVTVCVATEYGREEQGQIPGAMIHTGRLDAAGMTEILHNADLCIDATHPYATEVTRNIRTACDEVGVPYKRLMREPSRVPEGSIVVKDADSAAEYLKDTDGNILLTTGAKELGSFASLGGERLYPRVLPVSESLEACEKIGIPKRNIIAMQGPFTSELNLALIRQFDIRYLVTKDGGARGGFAEKAEAADQSGIKLIVLSPPEDKGEDQDSILNYCRELLK